MSGGVWVIARKELARFFSNKAQALSVIVLPGLLLLIMWSLMGNVMEDMTNKQTESHAITVVAMPASLEPAFEAGGLEVTPVSGLSPDECRALVPGETEAVVVFPDGFDQDTAVYDAATGEAAPQVAVYYDSSTAASMEAFTQITTVLDAYEASISNRFDVNAGEEAYDVAPEGSANALAVSYMASFLPLLILLFLFTSIMSLAAEVVAGEKERGTIATLLVTPVKRSQIALGKVLALSLIAVLGAVVTVACVMASLPQLLQGAFTFNTFGVADYLLIALVVVTTAPLLVALMSIVSTFAKTTKEAQTYLMPLMIVVMAVGLLGMVDLPQSGPWIYAVPLYNVVLCLKGILTFDVSVMNLVITSVSNVVFTGIGIVVLQRLFNDERVMFAR